MHRKKLNRMRSPAIWFRRYAGTAALSKLGGLPNLPPDTEWPHQRRSDTPLHFLAQIDLSQLPSTPLDGAPKGPRLPKTGYLFFFADMVEEMLWGENGGPLATTRVIYTRRTGPERSPPDDTPDIGHPSERRAASTPKVTPRSRKRRWNRTSSKPSGVLNHSLPLMTATRRQSKQRWSRQLRRQSALHFEYSQVRARTPPLKLKIRVSIFRSCNYVMEPCDGNSTARCTKCWALVRISRARPNAHARTATSC